MESRLLFPMDVILWNLYEALFDVVRLPCATDNDLPNGQTHLGCLSISQKP